MEVENIKPGGYDFKEGEVLLFDKPYEWTSFDLVNKVRKLVRTALGVKKIKVGHAGTLDPLATGLLIVCTGKATKTIDSYQAKEKEYVATLKLGATTPSFDLETEIDAQYPTEHINRALIDNTLEKFIGELEQIPPAFSAVKVKGKRAYELARQGKVPDLKPKKLIISRIEVLEFYENQLVLRIVCSKGTYIRGLARDIGQALNSGAHLTALKRTRIGLFINENSMNIESFEKKLK
ncbi:tRNA pseudouridine(55) synthase TruB [Saccharicrinis fermentans]|uniref:tRNA pseudouridine synthase B n=1 Tax=Saccharicrinis fermentans DSM 9555 = JCM 21142 TaxID=869213 RepID=W7XY45_9BACT|nr:tRNA pseudouridine(55) synthase TruB [Saccharicrinis fermentans]GAF03530.1 tRNA pseudouridine synthase B [Saccharicrinis fermentans DSM 9555 = JCM 21142]